MTAAITPLFYKRDYGARLAALPVRWVVNRYSHAAIGGPRRASLTAYGDVHALWELAELLRCPLELADERGALVWWGYVADVTIRVNALEMGVSVQEMANRVAVAYSLVDPGVTGVGTRATTTWAQDAESMGTYGTKERLESLAIATAAQAEAARDTALAVKRWPVVSVNGSGARESLSATLIGHGWWDTLDWRYYAQAGTASVETTAQIAAAVTAVGQFLGGTLVTDASGVSSSQYRDGDTTALRVVEELLASGKSGGRRLLARVLPPAGAWPKLELYAEPLAADARHYLGTDLRLFERQTEAPRWTCPVGVWARLRDVVPATADLTKTANPSSVFIEDSEYDPQTDEWRPVARSVPSGLAVIAGLETP